jgi:hypothetical protein
MLGKKILFSRHTGIKPNSIFSKMYLVGKKLDAILFKIDFEKAYVKLNWSFLQQVMCMKEFHPK